MTTEQHMSGVRIPRYTAVVVARARALAAAEWQVASICRLLAKEFDIPAPAWVTVKGWVDEEHAEKERGRHRRAYAIRQHSRQPLRRISPELALDRMRELYSRGVSLRSIGQVAAIWWGEELSAKQVRSRLGLKSGEVARSLEGRRAA